MAVPILKPSTSSGCAGSPACCLTNVVSARSAWLRTTDGGLEVATQGSRVHESQLGVWTAANRRQDAPHVLHAALLDDGDVAGRLADDLVDRRAEDRFGATLPASASSPAEDDQIGLVLCGQLDDTLRGPTSDAYHGAELDARWCELEYPLQQPARLARLGGTLGQRHSLWHLDDAERRQGAAVLQQRGTNTHEVGRRARVRQRQHDPLRQRRRRRHLGTCAVSSSSATGTDSASGVEGALDQRSTR